MHQSWDIDARTEQLKARISVQELAEKKRVEAARESQDELGDA